MQNACDYFFDSNNSTNSPISSNFYPEDAEIYDEINDYLQLPSTEEENYRVKTTFNCEKKVKPDMFGETCLVADESTKLHFETSFVAAPQRIIEEKKVNDNEAIQTPLVIPDYIDDVWEYLFNDEEEPQTTKVIQITAEKAKKTQKKDNSDAKMPKKLKEKIESKNRKTFDDESEEDCKASKKKNSIPSICKNLKGAVATGFAQCTFNEEFQTIVKSVIYNTIDSTDLLSTMTLDQVLDAVKDYIQTELRGKTFKKSGDKSVETYKMGTNKDIERVLYLKGVQNVTQLTRFVADTVRTLLIDEFIGSRFYEKWANMNLDIKDRDLLMLEVDQVRKVFAEPGYRFDIKRYQNKLL